jgi:hypothetical protein
MPWLEEPFSLDVNDVITLRYEDDRKDVAVFGNDTRSRMFEILIPEVLEALEENLKNHDEIYNEALENYRKAAIEKLDQMLADAKDGKPIKTSVGLQVPESYRDNFTSTIALLKSLQNGGDEKVEMSAVEYNRYVLNKWDWVGSFNASNARYTAGGKML